MDLTSSVRLNIVRNGIRRPVGWREVALLDWTSFGLVLGGGGLTGGAFEAGILLALEWDHGVQPTLAESLVGTSAGAIGATLLSLGFAAGDIAAMFNGVGLSPFGPKNDTFTLDTTVPSVDLYHLVRPSNPMALARSAWHLAHWRLRSAVLEWMRPGDVDPHSFVRTFAGVEWSDRPRLQVCATDFDTGGRVVFGRGSDVSLIDALAASCAVPGVMSPVDLSTRRLVDGGVWSPTNADLMAGPEGPRTVVIVSPMSGDHARTPSGRITSQFAASRLARELRGFDRSQTVLVVEPSGALSAAVVDDPLAGSAVGEVLLGAFMAYPLVP
jgi:NTE family protein